MLRQFLLSPIACALLLTQSHAAEDPSQLLDGWPAWQPSATISALVAATQALSVMVDLRQAPSGGMVHARVDMPVTTRPMRVVYPLWIPGTHAPSGPVANLGRLVFRTPNGATVAWTREATDPWRFRVDVPADCTRLQADLSYIANQSNVNSIGVDMHVTARSAALNWNCMLVLPEGANPAALPIRASLRLPARWSWACVLQALPADPLNDSKDVVHFFSDVETLVDSPLIAGQRVQQWVLGQCGSATVSLAVVNSEPALFRDERWLTRLRRLPGEANAIFGGAWFERYSALVFIGSEALGLEHAASSLNGMDQDALDFSTAGFWSATLIPHEFTHAWVGKARRPAPMCTHDYQQTPDTGLLWVYEGLTTHYGHVLATRCDLVTVPEMRRDLAGTIAMMAGMPGRHWRSLRDTALASWQLRGGSRYHSGWRRSQDYYSEGALFWLMVDLRLRSASQGRTTLDTFAHDFFGPRSGLRRAYTENELLAALRTLSPSVDWAGLITRWIDRAGPLDPQLLDGSGWRLEQGPLPADGGSDDLLADAPWYAVRETLGMYVSGSEVVALNAGSPAAKAGLRDGDTVLSVNGHAVDGDVAMHLARAAAATIDSGTAAVRMRRDGRERVLTLRTRSGLSYPRLSRMASEADVLADILAPRSWSRPVPPVLPAPAPSASAAMPVNAESATPTR